MASKTEQIAELLRKGLNNGSESKESPWAGDPDAPGSASAAETDTGTGPGEGEDHQADPGQQEESEAQQSYTLDALAEKLGGKSADLYNQVQVPMGHGQHMTLGELKDLALDGKRAQSEIDNIRAEVNNKHTELLAQRQEVLKLADMIGPNLSQDDLAKFREVNDARIDREKSLLMQAIPSWRDPATATREEGEIMRLAARYGISQPEAEALLNDHRLIKLVRDAAISQTRPPAAKQPAAPRRPADRINDAYKRGLEAKTKQDKMSAIADLLKGT